MEFERLEGRLLQALLDRPLLLLDLATGKGEVGRDGEGFVVQADGGAAAEHGEHRRGESPLFEQDQHVLPEIIGVGLCVSSHVQIPNRDRPNVEK